MLGGRRARVEFAEPSVWPEENPENSRGAARWFSRWPERAWETS
jgi:hypothetical protein